MYSIQQGTACALSLAKLALDLYCLGELFSASGARMTQSPKAQDGGDIQSPSAQKGQGWQWYGAAVVGVAVCWALRAGLDPWLGEQQPFGVFILPVLLLAWRGATRPALLAAALGWLCGDWSFLPVRGSILRGGLGELVPSLVYLGACALFIAVTCQMHRARRRTESLLRRLEEETQRGLAERQQAEAALRESEERFRTLADNMSQFAWMADGQGSIFWYNRRWYEFTGTDFGEMQGWGWQKVHHPEHVQRVTEKFRAHLQTGQAWEDTFPLRGRDGQYRWFLSRAMPIRDAQGQVVRWFGTNTDITEQRQAEEALRRQARLVDLAPAANIVRDLNGSIRFWSDGAEKLYGWTRQEAVGRTTHELLQTEFPAELAAILEALRRGGRWSGELRHRTKDGRTVVVESHWLGQFSPEGQLVELLESNMDITQRTQSEEELRRLTDQLEVRVQERTAALEAANKELEAFGYSVSHDLRAPLRHIDSYGKLLEKNVGPSLDDKSRKHLRIVLDAVKRMGHLLDDLLVLSRLGRAAMEERPVSLRRLVDEARQELAPAMAGRAIEWRVGPLPRVQGDANLLRSAISNLLSNAIKYTRPRNPALIEVGSRQQDGELVCFVRDNGAGFDMKFGDKLFGVFQRLHTVREFEGTGIGLASVRRVIQRHGGRTWAEGAVDRGASFYFTLPLHRVTNPAE